RREGLPVAAPRAALAGTLRGPVGVGREAARAGRVRARAPEAARRGTLRARAARLHALDGAEPPLPRSDHAAALEGRARGLALALFERRARRPRRTLHAAGGRRDEGGAAGAEVRRGAVA